MFLFKMRTSTSLISTHFCPFSLVEIFSFVRDIGPVTLELEEDVTSVTPGALPPSSCLPTPPSIPVLAPPLLYSSSSDETCKVR
jgi:hypothetical protein